MPLGLTTTAPFVGSVALLNTSGLPSASLAVTVPLTGVSSAVVRASALATGTSFTAVMLKLMVLGEASVSTPPLATPPLSLTWKVKLPTPVPLKLGAAVKTSWPSWPAGISWPAVTATPFRRRMPWAPGGRLVMMTLCSALAGLSSASPKPKSTAAKVRVPSSTMV